MKAIAEMFEVSRPALYKWFGRNSSHFLEGLQRRSRNAAGYTLNQDFFNQWTPEMAYVLGVLATDGHISKHRFTLTSTDVELVEKVKSLLRSDHRVVQPRGWARKNQYLLSISSTQLAKKLMELGVGPAKSLTLIFPEMPKDFVRHFLRGCWDGDGSFYFESCTHNRREGQTENENILNFRASFVSGSKQFIEGLITKINDAGIKPRRAPKPLAIGIRGDIQRFRYFRTLRTYETRRGRSVSYTVRLVGANAVSLGRLLYDGVPESMYLKRKYEIFCRAVASAASSGLNR